MTSLPPLPAQHSQFLQYVNAHPDTPIRDLVKPYNEYDAVLRKIYAQEPSHPAIANGLVNVVPLFDANGSTDLRIRARNLALESDETKTKYLMPLKDEHRKTNGSPAVVSNIKAFQTHFNIFSESSLSDLDWNNVVAAGSAVATSILPVPEKYSDSKRGMRQFYHEEFAPASDVDLFLYGLTEEQAIEKIKQIERCIRDSILTEVSTIRTKNAITIVSQYPTRHVQIVLRRYKSIAEILTGFDVDCSCAAYDGKQVYLAPRAVGAYMTQVNQVDLTRRSPSYENRLSKYSHRGFEVFWPDLDRSRIDPSVFERSFTRTVGLARLLVLEKLPKSSDRDQYLAQRRKERGRPPVHTYYRPTLHGNIKNDWQDEVAEWVEEDEVSDYHTFTIPYGVKFHARKIEKLLYTKDLLLNAEWNKPKDREVNLHRHPAFFGSASDVMHDCCGYCPKPSTPEEEEVAAEESKIYISGDISFISDNPGRQEIGSFNPITDTDWTEMAYVGNTEGLCQAIVENDLEDVQRWLNQGEIDVNRRDHTGRTPLHLACMTSTPEIVQILVDKGARMIARVADGRTALHLAAARGSVEIVRILLTKSEQNEEEESRKEDARKEALKAEKGNTSQEEDSDAEMIDKLSDSDDDNDDDNDKYAHSHTTGSFVKITKNEAEEQSQSAVPEDTNDQDPDIYDINVQSWDNKTSPLHLAILNGHIDVVEELVTSFGADALLPVKLVHSYRNAPRAAILSLVLAMRLPKDAAKAMTEKLLQVGASPAQGDMNHKTALHYLSHYGHPDLLEVYAQHDSPGVSRAINHLSTQGSHYSFSAESPLTHAITVKDRKKITTLLDMGAHPSIQIEEYIKAAETMEAGTHWGSRSVSMDERKKNWQTNITQPVILAIVQDMPAVASELLARGADPNTLTPDGYKVVHDHWSRGSMSDSSLLNYVQKKLEVLRKYNGERINVEKPKNLLNPDDTAYLSSFKDGSYQMWVAKAQLKQKRREQAQHEKNYAEEVQEKKNGEGLTQKQAAIDILRAEYEVLEADLLARGAKTFKELHPDVDPPANQNRYNHHYNHHNSMVDAEPWKVRFVFRAMNCTDEMTEGYIKLFEAAWAGDIDTIKSLTLTNWGPDKAFAPLEIGVLDTRNFTAFTLAILRRHIEAAKTILAIAITQYKPNEKPNNTRYRIMTDVDSDDDMYSDAGSDDIQLDTHVIDAQFTVDNIGEVKNAVESKISPQTVLLGRCSIGPFLRKSERPDDGKSSLDDLMEYAIWMDDVELLKLLITLGQELMARKKEDQQDNQSTIYTLPHSDFIMAIRLGRIRCLEEMIKRTGAGLPLDKLAANSGVEMKEKPKYYQGLSVHGKKRADWAARGGGQPVTQAMDMNPPLLLAAKEGSLEVVEWFLSTAPGRYYTEFAKAHRKDARLKKLAMSKKGLEQSILEWLDSRRDLVLHCAVLAPQTEASHRLIKYLAATHPQYLEVKSLDDYTPLAITFQTHKATFARTILEAGANQTVRAKDGMNLVHLALNSIVTPKDACLDTMLSLIDPRLVPSMLIERCSANPGSLTPLALWMATKYHSGLVDAIATKDLSLLLDLADNTQPGQKHLELLDGSGNTVLHNAVNAQHGLPLQLFLSRRPDLLHRENAVGTTPAELAENKWIGKMTSDPPSAPSRNFRDLHSCGILGKSPKDFSKREDEQVIERKNWTERDMYNLCKSTNAEGRSGKRKLVSLFDANEVAKRLALGAPGGNGGFASRRYRRRRARFNGEEEECAAGDEVSQWL
ncbi:ankyrin repeat protein [Aspergillus stella-maris]|uniref:ankyrin repeat protein n=1 Tax=Aspergillus stella-maris TaxID=1810926 RepID=UPI003CCD77CC